LPRISFKDQAEAEKVEISNPTIDIIAPGMPALHVTDRGGNPIKIKPAKKALCQFSNKP